MLQSIKLVHYDSIHQQAFEVYPLPPEQLKFTSLPLDLLKDSAQSKLPVTILAENMIIGFFVLDVSDDRYFYTDNPNSILLRGFSIHPDYQGQGIAKRALQALPTFIQEQFPLIEEVVLGVNEHNEPAKHVYMKAGFIDEGRRHKGAKGQQLALHLQVSYPK